MGSVRTNVSKERFLRLDVLTNEFIRLVKEHVRAKTLGLHDLPIMKIATVEISIVPNVRSLSDTATPMAIDFLEPTILRTIRLIVPHMPLPEHARFISVILEHLANCTLVSPQHRSSHYGVPDSSTVGPVPGDEGGPRR